MKSEAVQPNRDHQEGNKQLNDPASLILQVEFCSNCEGHLFSVRHQEDKYLQHFENLKKKMQEHGIILKKRAIPQHIHKKSPYCPPNVYYSFDTNEMVYFPKIGSFEIYFGGNKIFSKLESLHWPSFEAILAKVKRDQPLVSEDHPSTGKIVKQQQKNTKNGDIVEFQSKKRYFRIKEKKEEGNRYSLEKRNLFARPGTNYQHTTNALRNQTNSQYRKGSSFGDRKNEEESQNHDLSQNQIIKLYSQRDRQSKPITRQTPVMPLPDTVKKGPEYVQNIYLQPIYPKTSVNLESFNRQKQYLSSKVHEQRLSYQKVKQERLTREVKVSEMKINHIKFNQMSEILMKEKPKETMKSINQRSEENQQNQRTQQELLHKEMEIFQKGQQQKHQNILIDPVKNKLDRLDDHKLEHLQNSQQSVGQQGQLNDCEVLEPDKLQEKQQNQQTNQKIKVQQQMEATANNITANMQGQKSGEPTGNNQLLKSEEYADEFEHNDEQKQSLKDKAEPEQEQENAPTPNPPKQTQSPIMEN